MTERLCFNFKLLIKDRTETNTIWDMVDIVLKQFLDTISKTDSIFTK